MHIYFSKSAANYILKNCQGVTPHPPLKGGRRRSVEWEGERESVEGRREGGRVWGKEGWEGKS